MHVRQLATKQVAYREYASGVLLVERCSILVSTCVNRVAVSDRVILCTVKYTGKSTTHAVTTRRAPETPAKLMPC